MLLLNALAYLDDRAQHAPDVCWQAALALDHAQRDYDFLRLNIEALAACLDISVNHAVMENTERATVVVAANLDWSDISSWSALADIAGHDERDNAVSGDVCIDAVENSYVSTEHWIVVKGTALVTNGNAKIILTENLSTYISLELIEVQSGACLGEDNIIRFENTYGHATSQPTQFRHAHRNRPRSGTRHRQHAHTSCLPSFTSSNVRQVARPSQVGL